jgi:hypothetical protein
MFWLVGEKSGAERFRAGQKALGARERGHRNRFGKTALIGADAR